MVLVGTTHATCAKPSTAPRLYKQGPLRFDEFRRDAEDAQPGKAYTMTRVLFKYSFHVRGRAGQHEARLTAIKVYSVFLPEASWWAAKEDEWLLDHEQGHLDIAEIAARRLQLTFNRRFKAKRWISATGKTSDKAKVALEAKIAKIMEVANEQVLEENKEYDASTSHGLWDKEQREARRIQQLTLKKLADELTKNQSRPTRQPTNSAATR